MSKKYSRWDDEREGSETTPEVILKVLGEESPESIYFTDLNEALIGIVRQQYRTLALYSWEKCIDVFMKRDGMTYEEAEEYMGFNTEGAWLGEYTPVILHESELCIPKSVSFKKKRGNLSAPPP